MKKTTIILSCILVLSIFSAYTQTLCDTQESFQDLCMTDEIRAYRTLIAEVLTVQEDEELAVKIQRITQLDMLIEMLQEDEQAYTPFTQEYKELREYCQMQREKLYHELVQLAALLKFYLENHETMTSKESYL